MQTAATRSGRCSATSRSLEIGEFEISGIESVLADANGEAIFGVVGVKDQSLIKGEVDDGARGLDRRRPGDAWSGIIRRGLINRGGINSEGERGNKVAVIAVVLNVASCISSLNILVSDRNALIVIDLIVEGNF